MGDRDQLFDYINDSNYVQIIRLKRAVINDSAMGTPTRARRTGKHLLEAKITNNQHTVYP